MTLEELAQLRTSRAPPPPPEPPRGRILTGKPMVADDAEAAENPRSRSAKLRVFEKARRNGAEGGGATEGAGEGAQGGAAPGGAAPGRGSVREGGRGKTRAAAAAQRQPPAAAGSKGKWGTTPAGEGALL